MLSIQVKRQSEFSVVGSTVDSTGFGWGRLPPVLIPTTRTLCESKYPGWVVHSYRSNRVFRKTLASHSRNDVLENVAVTVSSISNKPVFSCRCPDQ